MNNEFRADMRASFKPKYTYQIHDEYLESFGKLTVKQQLLLRNMIKRLTLTHDPSSYIGTASYTDFGYDNRQNYNRDKKALVASRFIVTSSKQYFVRLEAVMYTSKRGYDNLCKSLGIMFDPLAFGSTKNYIPPVPK